MVKLSGLMSALAPVDGREPATLNWTAKVLQQAQVISVGKRGRGGAEMSLTDARNTLIGVAASQTPASAPYCASRYSSLKLHSVKQRSVNSVLGCLENCENFGDAIEALISNAGDIFTEFLAVTAAMIPGIQSDPSHQQAVMQGIAARLNIVFKAGPSAEINVERIVESRFQKVLFWQYIQDTRRDDWSSYYVPDQGHGSDRQVEVTIHLPTIMAAHRALSGG